MKLALTLSLLLVAVACRPRASGLSEGGANIESLSGAEVRFVCDLGLPIAFGELRTDYREKSRHIFSVLPIKKNAAKEQELFGVSPNSKDCGFGIPEKPVSAGTTTAGVTDFSYGITIGGRIKPKEKPGTQKSSSNIIRAFEPANLPLKTAYKPLSGLGLPANLPSGLGYKVAGHTSFQRESIALWNQYEIIWNQKRFSSHAPIVEVEVVGGSLLFSTGSPPTLYSMRYNTHKELKGSGPFDLIANAKKITGEVRRNNVRMHDYKNFTYDYSDEVVYLSNRNLLLYDKLTHINGNQDPNQKFPQGGYLRSFEVEQYAQDKSLFFTINTQDKIEKSKGKVFCTPMLNDGDIISSMDVMRFKHGKMCLNVLGVGYRPEGSSTTLFRLLWQNPYKYYGTEPCVILPYPKKNPLYCLEEFRGKGSENAFVDLRGVSKVRFAPTQRHQNYKTLRMQFATVGEAPSRMAAGIESMDLRINVHRKIFSDVSQHMNTLLWRGPFVDKTIHVDSLIIRNVGLDQLKEVDIWWSSPNILNVKLPDNSIYSWDDRNVLEAIRAKSINSSKGDANCSSCGFPQGELQEMLQQEVPK